MLPRGIPRKEDIMEREKIKVGVVGATGTVGRRFLSLLADHPYFEVAALAASPRSVGKTYREALGGRADAGTFGDMMMIDSSDTRRMAELCSFVFCATNLPKQETIALEESYARAELPVISNNSANRATPDVPMVIPEINAEHFCVIEAQKKRLGTRRGFIAVKPNCSVQSYLPMLFPLLGYRIEKVFVTTLQAVSGAGRTLDDWREMNRNIIPFIAGEEEKSEREPLKILGKAEGGRIVPADGPQISARCIRVPVSDGHTASVFVTFSGAAPDLHEVIGRWESFRGLPQELSLPSAPERFITYYNEEDRPQCILDRGLYRGMGISAGRLTSDGERGIKFIGLSHNTLRGAAGGAVLNAELLLKLGYL